jgi:hypothetical protein
MTPEKRNPVPLAAGRAPNSFCLAAERSVDTQTHRDFQAKLLAHRYGLAPPTARLFASLAFAEARI